MGLEVIPEAIPELQAVTGIRRTAAMEVRAAAVEEARPIVLSMAGLAGQVDFQVVVEVEVVLRYRAEQQSEEQVETEVAVLCM